VSSAPACELLERLKDEEDIHVRIPEKKLA